MDQDGRIRRLRAELDAMRDPGLGYVRASLPRFDRLFGRDSLIVSWQRLEREPAIAVATLKLLASMQAAKDDAEHEEEPGKILHEWAPAPVPWVRWTFPYYGSVDATPLFVIVAAWTVARTGDQELKAALWPHVKAALGWIAQNMDADPRGLLTYDPRAKTTLLHQGWKDSGNLGPKPPVAIVEAQGYAFAAFLHAAEWAETIEPALADDWRARAGRVRDALEERFWMPGAEYYAMAVQGDGRQSDAGQGETSRPFVTESPVAKSVTSCPRAMSPSVSSETMNSIPRTCVAAPVSISVRTARFSSRQV